MTKRAALALAAVTLVGCVNRSASPPPSTFAAVSSTAPPSSAPRLPSSTTPSTVVCPEGGPPTVSPIEYLTERGTPYAYVDVTNTFTAAVTVTAAVNMVGSLAPLDGPAVLLPGETARYASLQPVPIGLAGGITVDTGWASPLDSSCPPPGQSGSRNSGG